MIMSKSVINDLDLIDRIAALVPKYPRILYLNSASELSNIPGFDCSDLFPNFTQAGWALGVVKRRFLSGERQWGLFREDF